MGLRGRRLTRVALKLDVVELMVALILKPNEIRMPALTT